MRLHLEVQLFHHGSGNDILTTPNIDNDRAHFAMGSASVVEDVMLQPLIVLNMCGLQDALNNESLPLITISDLFLLNLILLVT
ncbi:hypothetical protein CRG98_049607, partial [Punica granatum]